MTDYCRSVHAHYSTKWASNPVERIWGKGPTRDLPLGFCVLEFAPTPVRKMWTYATCCMSVPSDLKPVELHLFSPIRSDSLVELLTAISHYHCKGKSIGLGHTLNFGRPWLDGSLCDHGLISLPYLDGPEIENCYQGAAGNVVQCLWLIPITQSERDYKQTHGLEALEQRFDQSGFDYLDFRRLPVVP